MATKRCDGEWGATTFISQDGAVSMATVGGSINTSKVHWRILCCHRNRCPYLARFKPSFETGGMASVLLSLFLLLYLLLKMYKRLRTAAIAVFLVSYPFGGFAVTKHTNINWLVDALIVRPVDGRFYHLPKIEGIKIRSPQMSGSYRVLLPLE